MARQKRAEDVTVPAPLRRPTTGHVAAEWTVTLAMGALFRSHPDAATALPPAPSWADSGSRVAYNLSPAHVVALADVVRSMRTTPMELSAPVTAQQRNGAGRIGRKLATCLATMTQEHLTNAGAPADVVAEWEAVRVPVLTTLGYSTD